MIATARSIFGQTYWSVRMRFWSWRENRALAKLQSRSVGLIADHLLSWYRAPDSPSLGEPTFIAEMAEQLRLHPLVFGDGKNFIKAIACELPLDEHSRGFETAKRSLEEHEAELIAEYDAHFLASTRIKSPAATVV